MNNFFHIGKRSIGPGHPAYVIAELSANHNGNFERAVKTIEAAAEAGADAVKLQTYTADTITIDCANEYFQIQGTLWEGKTLHDLYGEAFTPWEWQPKLKQIAEDLGLDCFSSPFDPTAVDFLESLNVPAYKVASFENVDLGLLRKIAETGKPVIMSTGMATLSEIDEAVNTLRASGTRALALLHCVSAYPAQPSEMNLKTIPHLRECFQVVAGLSDHTEGIAVPIAAVAQGACIIEKHFTLSRAEPGPDSAFSIEPHELRTMIEGIRAAEQALGAVHYGLTEKEQGSRIFRRSLFIVKDLKAGELLSPGNVRSIRPGNGLHTRYYEQILGRSVLTDVTRGTPLTWDLIGGARVKEEALS